MDCIISDKANECVNVIRYKSHFIIYFQLNENDIKLARLIRLIRARTHSLTHTNGRASTFSHNFSHPLHFFSRCAWALDAECLYSGVGTSAK